MRVTEPCQICGKEAVTRYPGNDPENGPARPYCPDGHSECDHCHEWFKAIVTVPAFTARYDEDDPKSEITVPESTHESSLCRKCEAQMMGFRDVEEMEAYERHEMARMHRLETTVKPEGMEVHTTRGSEGPSHDPYSYTKYDVTMPEPDPLSKACTFCHAPPGVQCTTVPYEEHAEHGNGKFHEIPHKPRRERHIVYHTGLGDELDVDGIEIARGDDAGKQFERLVGFPLDQLDWWGDEPYRGVPCMACGREGCRGRCVE